MRQRHWWLRLVIVLTCVVAFSGGLGTSAANEWQYIATPGAERIFRAELQPVQSFVAPPARPAELRAQAAQFTVEYQGFSPEAQAAFQYAVDIWQRLLDAPIPIRVQATWTPLEEGVLGSAGSAGFLVDQNTRTAFPVSLGQQLVRQDPNPGAADIVARFNSTGVDWYYGTGQAPAGQYNLATVVLHELAHGLGFADSFDVENGVGRWGEDNIALVFDRFVFNANGVSLTDTTRFANPSASLAEQLQSNALFFNGQRTRAANGGTPPRLFAPNPFIRGSSIAHFDEQTYPAGNPNSLMTPGLRPGESIYDPGALALGVFADIGWSIAAGPAPSPSPTRPIASSCRRSSATCAPR
jgi:hypothetical protein